MKKTILLIFSAILSLSALSSCDGMLAEKNYGNPTNEDMMKSEENVILLVGQAYADVKWLHDHWGYWGVASLTSDECVCPIRMPGEHWSDGSYWRNLNTHNWVPLATAFKNIWDTTISGAVLCNKLLNTLEESKQSMSENVYKQYVGELEVLRSYYYYMLFDCFGRIPYLEVFEDKTEPLMDPQTVWTKLVSNLEKNAPNLPVVNDANRATNYGRVTQGFAYTLLARLYLNAESFGCTPANIGKIDGIDIKSPADFYTNAVRSCDKVITSGSYSIEDNYFNNFLIDNSGSRENIFVIVENGNGDFDSRNRGSMSNKLRLNMLTLNYSHQYAFAKTLVEKPWNGFCARPSFLDRYNETDVRGPGNESKGTQNEHRWGWFVGPVYNADGSAIIKDENGDQSIIRKEIKSLTEATWNDGARLYKYEIDKEAKYQYCENDFVLFRYADVLWMKEEALLRGGSGSSAYESADFKKLRARSFAYGKGETDYIKAYPALASASTLTLDAICDERGREFSWENIRRRDLIRFGKFNNPAYVEYVSATDAYRKWFPIPYSVLEKSKRDENGKAIWTQNEGYPEM